MNKERAVNVAAVVVGVMLLVVAGFYFAESASSLPSWLPGHEAGSSHHHVKHGIAALVVALGLGVLVWFRTGPQTRAAAGR